MNNNLIKIFCFLILFGSSLLTLSQDKIKFGYHDQSGNVKNINAKEIEEKIEEIKITSSSISEKISDTIISEFNSKIFISEIKDTILVSVLLPLYVDKNNILINFLKENKKDTNQIYVKSELALSFLEGVLFALDSLSNLQIPLKLQVFDTKNNIDTVRKIANSDFVKQSTIIFGPIYSKNFNFLRNKFDRDTNKIIINPLSDNENFLQNNQNVYFLQPLKKQKDSIFCLFIKKFEKSKNIFFVSLESDEKISEYNIMKDILENVFIELPFKEFESLSEINKKSFDFLENEDNVVFILSENELFIKKIITFIRAIDTNVSIYSSDKIIDIKEIDIETLMKLDIRVLVANYFANYSKKNRNLQSKFENIFYHKMNQYSRLAFYSMLHFCGNQEQLNFDQYDGGGFINTDVQICTYKDYRLIPIE